MYIVCNDRNRIALCPDSMSVVCNLLLHGLSVDELPATEAAEFAYCRNVTYCGGCDARVYLKRQRINNLVGIVGIALSAHAEVIRQLTHVRVISEVN